MSGVPLLRQDRAWVAWIAVFALVQLWLASTFELGHDEAYYWVFSRHLDWGYFDHPPMVAVLIRACSLFGNSEGAVRSLFVLLQAATFALVLWMAPQARRTLAAALFLAFPLPSILGMLAWPDTPLLFLTAVYCLFLRNFLRAATAASTLGLSLVIPALLYTKYHALLLVFFTVLAVPSLLKRRAFYVVAALSGALYVPHLVWQASHGWVSLRYHLLERPPGHFSVRNLAEYVATVVALAGVLCGPVTWWAVLRAPGGRAAPDFSRALKFICVGTFVFFFVTTGSKRFEANWVMFLSAPMILLALESDIWDGRWPIRLLAASLALVLPARGLFAVTPVPQAIRRLHEFHGWRSWAQQVRASCGTSVLANHYQVSAKLSFYLNENVHSLNLNSRGNQFDFWSPDRRYYAGATTCYLTRSGALGGELLLTPEGRPLYLVRQFPVSALGLRRSRPRGTPTRRRARSAPS